MIILSYSMSNTMEKYIAKGQLKIGIAKRSTVEFSLFVNPRHWINVR